MSFELEKQSEDVSLRIRYRRKIRMLWDQLGPDETKDEKLVRRVFRLNRPDLTFKNHWAYRLWREEALRVQGKPVACRRKRAVKKANVMPCMREWAAKKGLILTDEKLRVSRDALPLEKGLQAEGDGRGRGARENEPPRPQVAG